MTGLPCTGHSRHPSQPSQPPHTHTFSVRGGPKREAEAHILLQQHHLDAISPAFGLDRQRKDPLKHSQPGSIHLTPTQVVITKPALLNHVDKPVRPSPAPSPAHHPSFHHLWLRRVGVPRDCNIRARGLNNSLHQKPRLSSVNPAVAALPQPA